MEEEEEEGAVELRGGGSVVDEWVCGQRQRAAFLRLPCRPRFVCRRSCVLVNYQIIAE